MDVLVALLAALAASLFAVDLVRDVQRAPRSHVMAYAAGFAMYALAAWALFWGVAFGWGGFSYKVFFLFGAVLNIAMLAVGSLFLVVGPRAGRGGLAVFNVLAVVSVLVVMFGALEPEIEGTVPRGSETFVSVVPPLLAAVGGGLGATVLMVAGLVSIFRFWRKDRRLVLGNVLIVAGVLTASSGGTLLAAFGRSSAFSFTLLAAVALIWIGYRVASGRSNRSAEAGRRQAASS